MSKELVERAFKGVLEGLTQVDKDQLFCIMSDRLNLLNSAILDGIDILSPENIVTYGKTKAILDLRVKLEQVCDQSLTDNL